MLAIESERFRDEIVLSARTLLVVLFLISGWSKLMNYDAAVSYMAMTNAPAPQIAAAIAIAIECLVSVAVLFGIFTRPLAVLMVAYTLATALIGHHYWTMSGADQYSNEINFYKNVSIMGGFLLLVARARASTRLTRLARKISRGYSIR